MKEKCDELRANFVMLMYKSATTFCTSTIVLLEQKKHKVITKGRI
jgi:hypothetical protein